MDDVPLAGKHPQVCLELGVGVCVAVDVGRNNVRGAVVKAVVEHGSCCFCLFCAVDLECVVHDCVCLRVSDIGEVFVAIVVFALDVQGCGLGRFYRALLLSKNVAVLVQVIFAALFGSGRPVGIFFVVAF